MREDITFPSDGRKLAGHLYLPDDRPAAERLPAVVVVGAYAIYKVRRRSSAAAAVRPAEPVDAEVDSELEPS